MKPAAIVRLYRSELTKVWRTKFPYLGLLASALMAAISRQQVESGSVGERTGSLMVSSSVVLASTSVIPIFSTAFSAMLVASEASRGTYRTILTRPVSRAEFLTAKLAMSFTYLLLLFAANLIPALLMARGYPLMRSDSGDLPLPGLAGQTWLFAIAIALTILPHLATACYAVCISVFSATPATAVGVAVGILLSFQTIGAIAGSDVENWMASSYYDDAFGIAKEKVDGIYADWNQPKTRLLLGVSAGTAALFLTAAYTRLLRRDLTTG